MKRTTYIWTDRHGVEHNIREISDEYLKKILLYCINNNYAFTSHTDNDVYEIFNEYYKRIHRKEESLDEILYDIDYGDTY